MKHLELFDSVNAGDSIREIIRENRNKKTIEWLNGSVFGYKPIYMITLEEYAELTTCHNFIKDLTVDQIKSCSFNIRIVKGNNHFWCPDSDAPLSEHMAHIQSKIDDTIDIYHETNGSYGTRGEFIYRRNIRQAFELGLSVPVKIVRQFFEIDSNNKLIK